MCQVSKWSWIVLKLVLLNLALRIVTSEREKTLNWLCLIYSYCL